MKQKGKTKIEKYFQNDTNWLIHVISDDNKESVVQNEIWSNQDREFSTDICLTGRGAWFKEKHFHNKFLHQKLKNEMY